MNTKRIIFSLCIVLCMFVSEVFAIEINEKEVTVTLSDAVVSRYVWRGQDLYPENDFAYQPSIDVSISDVWAGALSFNIWGSFSLNKGHEDAEELDYSLSFAKDAFDGVLTVAKGYTYFDYPNAASTSDVGEPWLSLTLNQIPKLPIDVAFTVFCGYDFKTQSGGPDEGWYYSWGLDTSLALGQSCLTQDGQTLDIGIVNWGNDGVGNLEPSRLYATELNLSTSYEASEINIAPSVHYIINHEEKINSGDDEVWVGVEFSYAF